jgi:hypothetical protein
MTIDRVATAARASASWPGSMDELMVFAVRSCVIPSPNASVDRRVKTDKRSPKYVPLRPCSRQPNASSYGRVIESGSEADNTILKELVGQVGQVRGL